MTVDDIIAGIFAREGDKYTDRAADKGGPTRLGITLPILSAWRGTACTGDDLKAMSLLEAQTIYESQFVKAPGFDRIQDEQLRVCVIDAGVNHSPARAVRWLQEIAGVAQDGIFGPASQAAVNAQDPRHVRARFLAARVRFYGRIVADDANKLKRDHGIDTQGENAAGWLDRAATFIEQL